MPEKDTHFIHDSLLGHVPNPGHSGSGFGNSFHTIDADGLRFGGEVPVSSDRAILAVGNSFTYGDEVRDDETWPAQLQRLTGRRVLNGGVTGYGLDQTVLRTEQLAARYNPSIIVLAFIADDVRRTEMRRMWSRDKPWFAIENDRLVLKGVPVPERSRLPLAVRRRLDRILVDLPASLQHLTGYHRRAHRRGFGLVIAHRLIERLARMQGDRRVRILIMAQYPPLTWSYRAFALEERRLVAPVLDHAANCGITTLDTFNRMASEPNPQDFHAVTHMNARGNAMIASLLAAHLAGPLADGRGLVRPPPVLDDNAGRLRGVWRGPSTSPDAADNQLGCARL